MTFIKYRPFTGILCVFLLISFQIAAQPGKDGSKTINSAGTVVNDYTYLTADAPSGTSILQVANNILNTGFSTPLIAGDLLFIVQVQGASMVTLDDPTYGNISTYNNCGNNEFAEVSSVLVSNRIGISCPLKNNYTSAGRVVVLRVPRYNTLYINSGTSITCPAWNGTTGGIVAIEVLNGTVIEGSIDVSGKGFRGGNILDNNSAYGVLNWRWQTDDFGAEKGESIAGSVSDYDNMGGRYCKGAPANGGGGGSGHNTGGGGGGNAGTIAYNGNGTPDVSNATWAAAWNLEYVGFAGSSSAGGGKGGYSFSSSNQNALTVGPFNSAWGGDQRRDNGGRGGRPLDYSSGRIFMGGGGGAGEQNDSKGGRGGNGAGIISFMSYAGITGNGQITANGDNGFNALTTNGTDGSGGGGAGGCIILNTTNATTTAIHANGGNGGSQSMPFFNSEAEGPGGGGGGGYIGISGGGPLRTAFGGVNGTTNSSSLAEFPPNGATKGSNGIENGSFSAFRILPQTINICSGTSKILTVVTQGTSSPGTVYSWYDQPVGGTLLGTGTSYTTPVLNSPQTYYVSSCPGISRVPIIVNTNGAMTASYTSSGNCSGSAISFTGTGSANIISWHWDFGDATAPSNQQNPTHIYSSGGTFQVVLTVGDGNCTMTVSQNISITTNPVANFTSSASGTTCGALPIQFTNTSTSASGYSWNFGDGTPLNTQQNPSHTYSSSGSYTVVLTASNSGCTSTHSLSVNIGNRPLASFTSTAAHCTNEVIQFTNMSAGNGSPITSWSWNFGDGSPLSSVQNPSHSYSTGGSFNVTLTANTANCFDDTTIVVNITAIPVVNFSASTANGCSPLTVNFSNTSSGSPVYTWNFGDGSSTSSSTAPSHIYSTAGLFSVTLIASQNGCADTLSVPNMITVANSPLSSYSSLTGICLGDSLHFTSTSNGNGSAITSYSWNFNDGSPLSTSANPVHAFPGAGNYNVQLTVSNGSCTDDTIRVINVTPGPVASFSTPLTSACGSLNASFTNSTSGSATFTWNFGDGSPLSTVTSPIHNFTSAGTYSVTLIATQGSCSDTLTQANYITVANSPLSSFNTNNVCDGDSVIFNNTSNGGGQPLTSYAWTFGDGGVSSFASPSHLYAGSGSYNVQLMVSNAGCSDDTIIAITVNPVPAVSFSSDITTACDSATAHFTNGSTGAASFNWTFGDGSTSSANNPSHTFLSPGNYSVTLTASSGSCSVTQTKLNLIVIHATPVVTINTAQSSLCKGSCISFNGTAAGATSWSWTFQGGSPATSGVQNPSNICYGGQGNYDVTLFVSDGFCSATQLLPAYIHVVDCSVAPHSSFISSDTIFCSNSCISFVDLSSNAQSWQWSFPGATPASSVIEHPVNICYPQSGMYDVTLITSNPIGYDTLILSNFIQVTAGPITPIVTQSGNTLTSTPANQYQWYLNNTIITGATSQQYTAILSGDYSVVVTDAGGCSANSAIMHVSLVGIQEFDSQLSFTLFPNPVNANLSVRFYSKMLSNLTLSITDATGREVLFQSIKINRDDQLININVDGFSSGVYFLHISSSDKKWVRPIIKN